MSTELATNERPTTVKAYLELPQYKARFGEVLGQRAPQFMAALVGLSSQGQLANCDPRSVIASAMVAATLDLPIEKSLGFAHVVPYGGVAQFQMAAKGYIQLALRSGQYQRINAKPINAEAFGGYDEVGEPKIDWSQLDETKPTIGYVVAWRLTNGFVKVAYWPKAKVEAHAAQFSQAFKKKKMDSPWFTNFDKMAIKTVVMNELRAWGILSVQMQTALKHDMGAQKDVEAEVEYVDGETLEIAGASDGQPATEAPKRNPAPPREKKGAAAVVENAKPDPKAGAIDVPTTPVAEKAAPISGEAGVVKASPPTAVTGAAATAEAAPASPDSATPISRAFLKDGEEVIALCTVVETVPMMMSVNGETKPSVRVRLKGEYAGPEPVVHHGGGTGGPPPAAMGYLPIWEPGNVVRVKLAGKLQPKAGKVAVRVLEVAQEGQAASPVEVME